MQYKNIDVNKLIPYVNNARKHSENQVTQLAASIKEFGFLNPILIDKDNGVLAGHGRLAAARKLGLKEVPCVQIEHLTPAQRKAYILADNKLAELAEWDNELLALEFAELKELGFDTSLTGFDNDMLAEIMPPEKSEPLTDEDAVPEVEDAPVVKRGDTWILGNHRLRCGDSTSAEDVALLMNGEKADMVFTDPPYGVSFKSNWTKRFDVLKNDDKILEISNIIYENMKNDSAAFIWTSHHVYPSWREQFNEFYKQTLIWHKSGSGMGDLSGQYALNYEIALFCAKGSPKFRRQRGMAVWKISKDAAADYVHPTQKPVELAQNAIEDFSDLNDNILDLFGGSGSTLIACEKTGRKCFMMELDEKYVQVIIKRFQQYTGKDAYHAETGETFNSLAAK